MKLHLKDTNISREGTCNVVQLVKPNSSLKDLEISKYVGDEQVRILDQALEDNPALTRLDIFGYGIGCEGIGELSRALCSNTNLSCLNLWHTKISDAGIRSIAEALKHNKGLKELSLHTSDRVADETVDVLVKSLEKKHNNTLQVLKLNSKRLQEIAPGHYNYDTMACRIQC